MTAPFPTSSSRRRRRASIARLVDAESRPLPDEVVAAKLVAGILRRQERAEIGDTGWREAKSCDANADRIFPVALLFDEDNLPLTPKQAYRSHQYWPQGFVAVARDRARAGYGDSFIAYHNQVLPRLLGDLAYEPQADRVADSSVKLILRLLVPSDEAALLTACGTDDNKVRLFTSFFARKYEQFLMGPDDYRTQPVLARFKAEIEPATALLPDAVLPHFMRYVFTDRRMGALNFDNQGHQIPNAFQKLLVEGSACPTRPAWREACRTHLADAFDLNARLLQTFLPLETVASWRQPDDAPDSAISRLWVHQTRLAQAEIDQLQQRLTDRRRDVAGHAPRVDASATVTDSHAETAKALTCDT